MVKYVLFSLKTLDKYCIRLTTCKKKICKFSVPYSDLHVNKSENVHVHYLIVTLCYDMGIVIIHVLVLHSP